MNQPGLIRDDYAGPGGWSVGLGMLGLHDVGVEWDAAACATRAAAGLTTIRADLATYRPDHRGGVWGYIASPPCQTFSAAGSGQGVAHLAAIVAAIHAEDWSVVETLDLRTRHVLDAARCALTLGPEWVAMEQVPAVLPVWRAVAERLRQHGYSAWAGELNAADYGVPQTRRRAVLIASRARTVGAPHATHAEFPEPTLFGPQRQPWVTMADALGWGETKRPSTALVTASGGGSPIDGGSNSRRARRARIAAGEFVLNPGRTTTQPNRRLYDPAEEPSPTIAFGNDAASWAWERPATTIVGSFRPDVVATPGYRTEVSWQDAPGSVRVEVEEAGVLQSFPADYPWQGSKSKRYQQVGNAIPPVLAMHVASAATGLARR